MKYVILFLLLINVLLVTAEQNQQKKTATIDIKLNVLEKNENQASNSLTIYESSSRKSTKLVPFFILSVLGLISIALIWKLL